MESKKVPDVMWFEFVFDKTGKFLTTHLSTPNAGILARLREFLALVDLDYHKFRFTAFMNIIEF